MEKIKEQKEIVSDSIRIHNALWKCYESKRNQDILINGRFYIIRYIFSANTDCARVEIDGNIWESQNMKKDSPNTKIVKNDPDTRITWQFYHSGESIVWLEKVQSHDANGIRHVERFDLRQRPNLRVETVNFPTNHLAA